MMRYAFTLIELLVVVAIILVLAGLVLAAAGPLMQQARRQRSGTIIQTLAATLAQSAAGSGGRIEPAEHPLAGSKAPRPAFVRADGTALPATGEALVGVEPAHLTPPSDCDRLLLPDDRYADPAVPLLYGLDRARIGIIGAPRVEVTAYRRLALGRGQASIASSGGFVVAPASGTEDHDRAVRSLLGEGALAELSGLGALYTPAADTDLAWDDRVVREPLSTSARRPLSRFRDPADGAWKTYRIRGLGLYDAWGRELLITLVRAGEYRIGSAGTDGCFVWSPGGDETYQTPPTASGPAGDDRDATRDNLWHPQP